MGTSLIRELSSIFSSCNKTPTTGCTFVDIENTKNTFKYLLSLFLSLFSCFCFFFRGVLVASLSSSVPPFYFLTCFKT